MLIYSNLFRMKKFIKKFEFIKLTILSLLYLYFLYHHFILIFRLLIILNLNFKLQNEKNKSR
jgi:hypothetical protein